MKNKGYIFPDPIDPGEYSCFRVYIPKHTLYLAAFWRAFEYFTQWNAWKRDDDHTGKEVAALWRSGYELSRAGFEAGDSCEANMAIDLRVKPGYPNISQVSTDGGETWHDFLIQPTWAGVISSIWPDVSTTGNAAAVAGGMLEGIALWFANQVIDGDGDGLSRDVIRNNIYAEFARFNPLPEVAPLIRPLVDSILDAPTPTAYIDECTYSDFWVQLKNWLTDHPNDFPNLLGNFFANLAGDLSDEILQQYANMYSAFAGTDAFYNFLSDHETLREATFGESCTVITEWDFTDGLPHNWVGVPDASCGGDVPTMGAGGWEAFGCAGDSRATIKYQGGDLTGIVHMEMDFNLGAACTLGTGWYDDGDAHGIGPFIDTGTGAGDGTRSEDVSADVATQLAFTSRATSGSLTIQKLRVTHALGDIVT